MRLTVPFNVGSEIMKNLMAEGVGFIADNHRAVAKDITGLNGGVNDGPKASIRATDPVERSSYDKDKGSTEKTRKLEKHIAVQMEQAIPSGTVTEVTVRNSAKVLAAKGLARLFGKRLVYIASTAPVLYGDAFAMDNIIFMRPDATAPTLVLLGHELTHHLRAHDEKLYKRLRDIVMAEVRPFAYANYREYDSQRREAAGVKRLKNAELTEELVSDFVGGEFATWDFWINLAKRDHPVLAEIVAWMQKVIKQLANKPYRQVEASAWRDVQRARDMAVDAMDAFLTAKTVKGVDGVKASVGRELSAELSAGRTFVNKLFEQQDLARYQIQRISRQLQKEVQRLAGSKRNRPTGPFAYDKEYVDSRKARDLNEAMMVYRDLKINPFKEAEFRVWAESALPAAKGKMKLQIKAQLATLDRAKNLTQEQMDFVDERMDRAFEKLTNIANEQGVTNSALDHYVRRVWKREDLKKNAGGSSYGFKTFTTASMQRSRETIMDGWMAGDDLSIKGITNSYQALGEDLCTVVANKRFIQLGMKNGIFTTKTLDGYDKLDAPGFSVWQVRAQYADRVDITNAGAELLEHLGGQDTKTSNFGSKLYAAPPDVRFAVFINDTDAKAKKLFDNLQDAEDYMEETGAERLEHRDVRNVFVKVPLYAPATTAEHLNRVTRKGSALWQSPLAKGILRFNAGINNNVAFGSNTCGTFPTVARLTLFPHLLLLRLGTGHFSDRCGLTPFPHLLLFIRPNHP